MSHELLAGTSIVDISPEKGVPLGGYPHHPRHNEGIHDPLFASCIYLDDGTTRLAIVCMDLLMYSKKHVRTVREQTATKTGIPSGNIMICCSHSHSAPRGSSSFTMDAVKRGATERGSEADTDYAFQLNRKLVDLIVEAIDSEFPARIGVDKGFCGREHGVGGNRRDPMGIADPEVWTIGVQDFEGNWKAALVRYALHPTFLHSDNFLVSADYPGSIRTCLNHHKPGMTVLFAQGTSGNQSPRYFRSGKTFTEAERAGRAIGEEANRVLDRMELSSELPLLAVSKQVEIELRRLPDRESAESSVAELRREWEELEASGASESDIWNAELRFLGAEDTLSLVILNERDELFVVNEELPAEVQVLGIGDGRIVGIQGELFVEFGISIQYRSPFPKTFVVELANGALPGYAATPRAYVAGGYEAGASLLTGRSGEQLVEAAVELLSQTERAEEGGSSRRADAQ